MVLQYPRQTLEGGVGVGGTPQQWQNSINSGWVGWQGSNVQINTALAIWKPDIHNNLKNTPKLWRALIVRRFNKKGIK